MRRKRIAFIITALSIALAAASPARSDSTPPLYLVDSPFDDLHSRVYRVNPDTGNLDLSADLGTDYSPILGMAAASGSVLYLTGSDNSVADACLGLRACLLLRVHLDPSSPSPSVELLGPVRDGEDVVTGITGMTFRRDGALYAVSQDTFGLYTIDPSSAAATRIGTVNLEVHGGDITFDGEDRLWLWTNIADGAGLYRLDPATAAASAFEIHPFLDMAGLAALGHGNRIEGASQSDDRLFEIDPLVGFTGNSWPFTLAGAPFDHSRGDLDSPFCDSDPACDDALVCTADRCSPGGCVHEEIPTCCVEDAQCDDGDACTTDRCADNRCVATPINLDDGDPCTVDLCDPAGGPSHLPGPDSDADGVLDCVDQCPGTETGDLINALGCSLAQTCPCAGPGRPWLNHGEYVNCIKAAAPAILTDDPAAQRLLFGAVRQAVQSSCGK
jgi:slime mold repeat-containing protein